MNRKTFERVGMVIHVLIAMGIMAISERWIEGLTVVVFSLFISLANMQSPFGLSNHGRTKFRVFGGTILGSWLLTLYIMFDHTSQQDAGYFIGGMFCGYYMFVDLRDNLAKKVKIVNSSDIKQ
jgi:hypothetical protein